MPEVSCITTTYKRPKELKRAIESVQKQTFEDWEHIIVYDGPADEETKAVVAEYKDDSRVKLIELEENHGNHTKPKNAGILASSGKYICYLDDDNEYLPSFMQTLKMEMELSQVDVVYGLERIFHEEGCVCQDCKSGNHEKNVTRGHEAISFPFNAQILLRRSFIDTNAVLHTREVVFKVGGWDETLPRFADWNLFVRMAKAGVSFKQIPIFITKYYLTKGNSAEKHPVRSWIDPETGLTMFDSTWFNPAGCYIYLPYLGDDREDEKNPKVAIFTITHDRLDYTKRTWETMKSSTKHPFDWFVFDNGSKDGTDDWISRLGAKWTRVEPSNKGLTVASNACVDEIKKGDYQIIGKVDNDCLFLSQGWLEAMVDLWKRNHLFYMAPYPEGLVEHPGGPWRVGYGAIEGQYVELTDHISGICAFIDAHAYDAFRWTDKFLHGQQDGEASRAFISMGYSCVILPTYRIQHIDTTAGQQEKYPEYFERRKKEKTTQV